MVARVPLVPTVNLAPGGPADTDKPPLLKFRLMPGAMRMRRKKRKDIDAVWT